MMEKTESKPNNYHTWIPSAIKLSILGHDLNDLDTMNRLSSAIDDSDNVDDIGSKFAIHATHTLGSNRNISRNNVDHMNGHGALRDTDVENNHGSSYNGLTFSGHRSVGSIGDVKVVMDGQLLPAAVVSPADLQNGQNQIHGLPLSDDINDRDNENKEMMIL